MSRIRIKNFGPVKEGNKANDGWIDIKKVTVFIGNQGSGKSTVAKLISTLTWIEKALNREEFISEWFMEIENFKFRLKFHRIEEYFLNNTLIEYEGESFKIKYDSGQVEINKVEDKNYLYPRIMYIPAERNFIAYSDNARALKGISGSLVNFIDEYDIARRGYKKVDIKLNNMYTEYNELEKVSYLTDNKNSYKIRLSEASSGFQSFVPMYLVSFNLSRLIKDRNDSNNTMSSLDRERFSKEMSIINESNLSDEQKRIAISDLSKKRFNESAFINIVEEPEQNLFPSSQWQMLQSLLEFNNETASNKLVITTHSPYLINYLTLTVKANILKSKISKDEIKSKLYKIVPLNSTVDPKELAIYELDENDGSIHLLDNYKGLPSDDNYLNIRLEEGNDMFAQLLEIQQML